MRGDYKIHRCEKTLLVTFVSVHYFSRPKKMTKKMTQTFFFVMLGNSQEWKCLGIISPFSRNVVA